MEQLEVNLKWTDQWDVSHKQHDVYCHGQAKKLQHMICKNLLFGLTMKVIFIVTGDCMSSLTDLKTVKKRLNKGNQFWK
jgi:hypothetical protein